MRFCLFLIFAFFIVSMSSDNITLPLLSVRWTDTNFKGKDCGVGSEGDTFIAGLDGKLYKYQIITNTYTEVYGDNEMPFISKVDVDSDGTPYIVTNRGGQIYYLDCQNKWVRIQGCANDIGVGRAGEIWKIGCDSRLGGFGVWKLFCNRKCGCNCNRSCIRFSSLRYAPLGTEQRKNCYWLRIEGGGKRLDVDPNGNPWIVADNNSVYQYDGFNWKYVPGYFANDIAISNDGTVFASGIDNNIGRLICPDVGTWQILTGAAKSICVGPFDLPFIIDGENNVFTCAKRDLN
jgi:hypothetical protein